MAFAPWNVLAAGKIRTDAEEQKRRETGEMGRTLWGDWERNEQERKVCAALEKVAGELGAKSITSGEYNPQKRNNGDHLYVMTTVAIAYLMQKSPYVFPVIGGRKVEHLRANLEALDISLTSEHIAFLESQVPFRKGFPYDMFVSKTL